MAGPPPEGVKWRPGQSGNPGGRPKAIKEVIELARTHTVTAIETLAGICTNVEAPPAARVAASQALLDRAWGKPVQPIDGDGEGGPIQLAFVIYGEKEKASTAEWQAANQPPA